MLISRKEDELWSSYVIRSLEELGGEFSLLTCCLGKYDGSDNKVVWEVRYSSSDPLDISISLRITHSGELSDVLLNDQERFDKPSRFDMPVEVMDETIDVGPHRSFHAISFILKSDQVTVKDIHNYGASISQNYQVGNEYDSATVAVDIIDYGKLLLKGK